MKFKCPSLHMKTLSVSPAYCRYKMYKIEIPPSSEIPKVLPSILQSGIDYKHVVFQSMFIKCILVLELASYSLVYSVI